MQVFKLCDECDLVSNRNLKKNLKIKIKIRRDSRKRIIAFCTLGTCSNLVLARDCYVSRSPAYLRREVSSSRKYLGPCYCRGGTNLQRRNGERDLRREKREIPDKEQAVRSSRPHKGRTSNTRKTYTVHRPCHDNTNVYQNLLLSFSLSSNSIWRLPGVFIRLTNWKPKQRFVQYCLLTCHTFKLPSSLHPLLPYLVCMFLWVSREESCG